VLVCRPTTSGTYGVSLVVRDRTGTDVESGLVTVVVFGAISVGLAARSATLLDLGENLTLDATVRGGSGAYTVSYQGLPSGCLSANVTGLTCRPNALGNSSVTVTVVDTLGEAALSGPVNVSVYSPLRASFSQPSLTLEVGVSAVVRANVSGGAPPVLSDWVELPPGCVPVGIDLECLPTTAGTYSAVLNVSDRAGNQVQAVALVDVVAILGATLAASRTQSDVGSPVVVSATVTGGEAPLQTAWGSDGGLSCTSGTLVTDCTPGQAGSATVWFIVTDALGGRQNVSQSLLVAAPLAVTLTDAVTQSCAAPFDVVVTAHPVGGTPEYTYEWTFGDGGNASSGRIAAHDYASAGTYTVVVVVGDAGGGSASPTLSVLVGPNASLCASHSNNGTNGTTGTAGTWLSSSPVWIVLVVALAIVVAVLLLRLRGRAPPPEEDPAESPSEPAVDELGWNQGPPDG
jgi:large repetitive protein